jgi:hypothetical protein
VTLRAAQMRVDGKVKQGLTEKNPVWAHVKQPKSSFSSEWSIRQKNFICLLIA